MVELNGGHGEGGGALLRTALAVAALTRQDLRVFAVRGAQRRPGLTAEDLAFIHILAESTSARVEGDDLDGMEVKFMPLHEPRPVRLEVDIQRYGRGRQSGCALVVAQAALPVLSRAGGPSTLAIRGETHSSGTITFEALMEAGLRLHAEQGLGAVLDLGLAGFDRDADGLIHFEIEPSRPEPLDWTAAWEPEEAGARLVWAGLNPKDVEAAAAEIEAELERAGAAPFLDVVEAPSRGRGACLTVWARGERGALAASASLKRSHRLEEMARPVREAMDRWRASRAALDPFLADQALLPAALAEGRTEFTTAEITRRLQTMARIIRQMMAIKVAVYGVEGEPGRITIER